jgi:bifunctional DNA-binding transcriptional regulator/antitoxin component of YhaV-PrlF toxin-antitoxin module
MITTITGKNQVTVPAALATKAKVHPGTRLDWELSDEADTFVVHILPDAGTVASSLRGRGRQYRRRGTSAVRNLVRERAREDRERS